MDENKNLTVGCDLNSRTITSSIPGTTEITEEKIIAKVNDDNYIAENLMTVEGQTGNCSVGYYHYINGDEIETAIFYLRNSGGTVVTNLEQFILPDDFGTVTEIDDTSVLYDYLVRGCHEKVYVICEDFCKEESMTKGQIIDTVEDEVQGYCVPTDSVIGWPDDVDIPEGYELTDETFGGGSDLPLNSIVDYDGNTVPSGFEEVSEWTYLGSANSTSPISLANINYSELYLIGSVKNTADDVGISIDFNIIKQALTSSASSYRKGYYDASSVNAAIYINIDLSSVSLNYALRNGTNKTSFSTVEVYYK